MGVGERDEAGVDGLCAGGCDCERAEEPISKLA